MKLKYYLALIMAMMTCLAQAQTPLAIPNTFTNGEIIDADNINQNFTEIETHVNTNQGHKHFYVVDANDVDLGIVDLNAAPEAGLLILTGKGYLFKIKNSLDNVEVYFESIDCSGQAYANLINIEVNFSNILLKRAVFWTENKQNYYIRDVNTEMIINAQSQYGSGSIHSTLPCLTVTTNGVTVNPFIQSTLSLTGIPNTITLPVRLEYK